MKDYRVWDFMYMAFQEMPNYSDRKQVCGCQGQGQGQGEGLDCRRQEGAILFLECSDG